MTGADFKRRALELLSGRLPRATTRELVEAVGGIRAGIGVHTAHGVLRLLEGQGAIQCDGWQGACVVWVLKEAPPALPPGGEP